MQNFYVSLHVNNNSILRSISLNVREKKEIFVSLWVNIINTDFRRSDTDFTDNISVK